MPFVQTAHHEWLLSDAVDILPYLLLPLAGPEELSEEENEGDASRGLFHKTSLPNKPGLFQ